VNARGFEKFRLTGKTAVVTGGGTGIGYFMARGLARCGARVLIAARREKVIADATIRLSAESDGAEVLYQCLDLADRSSIRQFVRHATEKVGAIDILVGNAGLNIQEDVGDIADGSMDQMFQVNVAANIALLRSFLPAMRDKKWGRAIFTSSVASLRGPPVDRASIYSMCKAGIDGFVRSAAAELGPHGITVNSIIPGTFKTDMLRDASETMDKAYGAGHALAYFEEFTAMTALGRMAECPEMEGLVQLLASEAGSYITGQSIAIDGGLSIMMRPNRT
jgi:gluconate 5-dehydrogenase